MGLLDSLADAFSPSQPQATPQPAAPQAPQDNAQTAYNFFVGKGYAPHQAAGIVGNLQGESGQGLNPSAVDRGDGRDGSDSIGIGQWNSGRAQALKAYAASKGASVNDLNTQLEFLHSELQGPESKANGRLMAATTPEEAATAMLGYERPKDWNKPGAHSNRLQYASNVYNTYGRSYPPDAMPAPASSVAPANAVPPTQAIPPQRAPILAGLSNFAPSGGQGLQLPPPAPLPQIFYAPRKPIDLSALRAALSRNT